MNNGNIKTPKHAAEVIKAMQDEYDKDVITDYQIPPLVNIKTGKPIGFAVQMQVSGKYDYNERLLAEWRDRFGADEYKINARSNQLWLTFIVRYFVPTEEHIAKKE